jgi:hypothetical protein
MTFRDAVEQTPSLKFCQGLNALAGNERQHIQAADTRCLSGSVNLDAAYKKSQPNASRWDYGVAYRQTAETVYWVEIHPAANSHISDIIDKKNWLVNWLNNDGRVFNAFPRHIVWVATGNATLATKDPKRRRLETAGVRYAGNTLRIP